MNTTDQVTRPPLSEEHRAYLTAHAISDEVLGSALIWSNGDLICFGWTDAPEATIQTRRWPPYENELVKYQWGTGKPLHFGAWRPVREDDTDPVIIAEGTKQSLAVASWAPEEHAVYGMPGCWGWRNRPEQGGTSHHRLGRFAGRVVYVILDADAAANLDVYEAGEKLGAELMLEDAASVAFVRMPGSGKEGIDDYLAGLDPGRRAERLAKLLAAAQPQPAVKRPTARKITETPPERNGLELLIVNSDRRQVIHTAIGELQRLHAGHRLFSYGGVLSRLRGAKTEPLDKDAFANWLAETVAMYKYKPPGIASPGSYEASWPDPVTMGAILSRGGDPEQFPELTQVSQAPFIRGDGSVCAKNGYDDVTGAMLVMGNSGMDRLDIPDQPSREDAAEAARYLLGTWLGDFSFRDEASQANALALVLTPFIRGLVPLVPLAVISGLQMGVGKNLMADCIAGVMTGTADVAPMPWIPDDDEENAKKLHAAFREGYSLMCFDEAHVIGGASITRAITAQTYQDRILGVSQMASYPNRVTWIALGNQVQVLADMARRAYYIELYPDVPNPQDRDDSYFRISDLRGWTEENRPELVTRALKLIRAWFAAGQPAFPRGTLMGSFERWDKMMSGILGYAGVPGFLSNLAERRAERDMTGGFWSDHLAWLHGQFGQDEFTALDVKTRAMASGGAWDAPPRLDRPSDDGFTRNLGVAYAHNKDRWYGRLRLIKTGVGHGTKGLWRVQVRDDGHDLHPLHPLHPSGHTLPELGGMKGMKYLVTSVTVSLIGDTLTELAVSTSFQAVSASSQVNEVRDEVYEVDETSQSAITRTRAGAHTRVREAGATRVSAASPASSTGPALGFDLETAGADDLFRWNRETDGTDSTEFVRLPGVVGPSGARQIVTVAQLLTVLGAAGRIDGHNILGFDGLALAWHHGMDWHAFAAKARDTILIARQVSPPRSRESGTSQDRYDLDHVAAELGVPGKTDDLKRLARQHGGYGKIPVDDPEYREYLMGDLAATRLVADRLVPYYDADPYLPREHRLAAITGQMRLNGFAVDHGLLGQRAEQTGDRKRQALGLLASGWDLPLDKAVMRGRGKDRHEERELLESPLAGKAGRAWLESMYARYGITDPPRTAKAGELAIGADDLAEVTSRPECPDELRTMITLMGVATGARTVYQTATDWLCPDGRVHPRISASQASGRWSTLDPGLTVYGKHEGRHVERDVFTPDPGEVLVSFDLSQVDMRAIAGHCQDPAYMALFAPGRDVHAEIAVQVFGDAKRRQEAKARGHGWNYGMGPERMIRDGVAPALAYGFDNGMRNSFPVLCSWREQIRAIGRQGMILDNGFGRRMRCEPRWAHTVAPALMGQGGARDIMGECLLRLPSWTWPMLRATVHDEIILSVPPDALAEVVRAVTAAMTWTWANVPILCDINGPGLSWGAISGKCPDCGKGAHGRGFCQVAAGLKRFAARHELDRS